MSYWTVQKFHNTSLSKSISKMALYYVIADVSCIKDNK